MFKKILLILLVVLTSFALPFGVNASSLYKIGIVSNVDKSEACKIMLVDHYVITVNYEDDYEFIQVPDDININLNSIVKKYSDYIIVNSTNYFSYVLNNGTVRIISEIDSKTIISPGISGDSLIFPISVLQTNIYKVEVIDDIYNIVEGDRYTKISGVDKSLLLSCDGYFLMKIIDGLQYELKRPTFNFADGKYALFNFNDLDIFFLVPTKFYEDYVDDFKNNYPTSIYMEYINAYYYWFSDSDKDNVADYYDMTLNNIECFFHSSEIKIEYLQLTDYLYKDKIGFTYYLNGELIDDSFDWISTYDKIFNLRLYNMYIHSSQILDGNDAGVNDFNSNSTNNLMLNDFIIDFNYDSVNYQEASLINLSQLSDLKGKSGRCVITNETDYYKYLFQDNSSDCSYYLNMKNFIPGYNLNSLDEAYYLVLQEGRKINLYIEMIFINGTHLLYNVNQNKISYTSVFKILSKNLTYEKLSGGVTDYYMYFNTSVPVDEWVSMTFDIDYHIISSNLFGHEKVGKSINKIYTIESEGSNIEGASPSNIYISSKLFGNDFDMMKNFNIVEDPYLINGNSYTNRVRLLSTVDNITGLFTLGPLFSHYDNEVEFEKISAVKVSYIKDETVYNEVYVESDIEVPGDDIIDDPYIEQYSPWNLKQFFKAISESIESNIFWDSIGDIIKDYYGAAILSVLIILAAIWILSLIISLIVGIFSTFRIIKRYKY